MEVDQSRRRGAEPAGVDVERRMLGLEVDVEPLASCRLRVMDGSAHDARADAVALPVAPRLGVEEERVIAAIPRDVDEPDEQAVRVACRHPAEAVWPDPVPPAGRGPAAVGLDELDQLAVADRASPDVVDQSLTGKPCTSSPARIMRWCQGRLRLRRARSSC